ncbi:M12 family metallopeptidase, partial [Streptomyces sp. NPDC048370]|uniref:M12 family metallopeptidase n=1 Tax=Streptomyces sp. NPDC048370 TaxID=3365540 RepID=UPI003720E96F
MGYALFKKAKRWPGGRIPYEIDSLSFPPGSADQVTIDAALAGWNRDTIVQFVPRNGEGDYIRIVPDEMKTSSATGRSGGGQKVRVSAYPGIPAGAAIATIHQQRDQVDCLYVDDSGAVRVIWVNAKGEWDGPVALTPPNTAAPGAALATGRQTEDQIDLFFVDGRGAVNVMWVVGNGPWNGPLTLTDPEKTRVPTNAVLVADRQTADQLDLFFVDEHGAVNVMWVVDTGTWNGPLELAPRGSVTPGASLATVHQTHEQLDLFYVGTGNEAGVITVVFVVGNGAWSKPIGLTGRGTASIIAPLAAARQTGDQIDLFYIGHDGAVNVMWVVGTGEWHEPISITEVGKARSGGALAAVGQTDDQLDLFFVDEDGAVNVMWVVDTGAWHEPVALTPTGTIPDTGALATARPTIKQLDLFYVGFDDRLSVMWVVDTGQWNGPVVFEPLNLTAGHIMHELGHALGLKHEHQRPDSVAFVTIVGGTPPNYGPAPDSTPIGPYDCDSIMHYPPQTDPPTLEVLNPACSNAGQYLGLSAGDIATANYAYGRVTTAGAALATEHQTDGQLNVTFADRFGAIAVTFVEGVGAWDGPIELTAADVVVPGTRIATATQVVPAAAPGSLTQTDRQIDTFFVDRTGAVNVMWVVGTGAWNGPIALTGPRTVLENAALATARQTDDQIDLFFVGEDGAVKVMWVVGTGAWNKPIALTPPDTVRKDAALATARQTDDQIDVFFVDRFGAVHVAWVVGTGAWNQALALTPPNTAPANAALATARQTDDQIDLFFVGEDGAVKVMWVV